MYAEQKLLEVYYMLHALRNYVGSMIIQQHHEILKHTQKINYFSLYLIENKHIPPF